MSSRKNFARYRQVLELRKSGKKFREIADLLKISRQRAWQIYARAVRRKDLYEVSAAKSPVEPQLYA